MILKELGYDDKAVNLLKEVKELDPKMAAFLLHWKTNGDVKDYLRELTTDYEKMPAEEVMRHQLRQEYPKVSEEQLNILFNRKITKAYSLDSEDEDEKAEGKMLLEAEASKYRDIFINKQQDFLLPKPPEPKPSDLEVQQQLLNKQREQQFEAYKSDIDNNTYTKEVFANNKISIGDGEERFSYPVDAKELKDEENCRLSIIRYKESGKWLLSIKYDLIILNYDLIQN